MRICANRSLLVLLLPLLASAGGLLRAQSRSTHGPVHGSLVLQGGVGFNQAIASAFVALAGGPGSHIVVIPTASVGDAGPPGMATYLARRMKESYGVAAVTVVHTNDRAEAETDSFIGPLRSATGVWMLGGFPEHLVQAYLGTKVERAINDLLDRGGVVGGESAGAMIQGSWLDTTDNEGFTPEILALIRKHTSGAGFGLLANAAVFPHFDKRGTAAAIKESGADPDQLAIGIDEETALIVSGVAARVVGSGTASMYDGASHAAPSVVILRSGDRYDLAARRKE
jgi:cyanophycinase